MYNKKDVILVKFPFTNLTNFKLRPALIIWEYKNDLILLAISSKKCNWVNYKIDNSDFKNGELLVKSYIKVNKISTLSKDIVFSKIWTLEKSVYTKIKSKFIEEIL